MVDDEDFDKVNQYSWSKKDTGYACAFYKGKMVYLHRFIMNILDTPEILIDHINRDKLDNRKCNLRKCNSRENTRNKKGSKNSSSKYKGVTLTYNGKWKATIHYDCKDIYMGTFNTEVEAAIAYNNIAKSIYGEFAFLNNIPEEFKEIIPKPFKSKCSYIGVELRPSGKYTVEIRKNKVRIHLGTFTDPIEAAKAYDAKAKELHGSKAKLNFPDNLDSEASLLCPELYEESVLNIANKGSETI